jgi:hypothetical protein
MRASARGTDAAALTDAPRHALLEQRVGVSFRAILFAGAKIVLLEGAFTFSTGFDPVANENGSSDWPTAAISGVD